MSTSSSRRQRREYQRMEKMPTWKVIKKFKHLLPENYKLKSDMVKGDQSYEEWLKNIQITPKMLKELEEHDEKLHKNSNFNFEEVSYKK